MIDHLIGKPFPIPYSCFFAFNQSSKDSWTKRALTFYFSSSLAGLVDVPLIQSDKFLYRFRVTPSENHFIDRKAGVI